MSDAPSPYATQHRLSDALFVALWIPGGYSSLHEAPAAKEIRSKRERGPSAG